jgi:hypothetical protein
MLAQHVAVIFMYTIERKGYLYYFDIILSENKAEYAIYKLNFLMKPKVIASDNFAILT